MKKSENSKFLFNTYPILKEIESVTYKLLKNNNLEQCLWTYREFCQSVCRGKLIILNIFSFRRERIKVMLLFQ